MQIFRKENRHFYKKNFSTFSFAASEKENEEHDQHEKYTRKTSKFSNISKVFGFTRKNMDDFHQFSLLLKKRRNHRRFRCFLKCVSS